MWARIKEKDNPFFDGFCNCMDALMIISQVIASCYVVGLYSKYISLCTMVVFAVIILMNYVFSKKKYEKRIEKSFEKRFAEHLSSILLENKYYKERFLFGFGRKCREAYEKKYDKVLKEESKIELFRCLSTKLGGIIFVLFFTAIVMVIISSDDTYLSMGGFVAMCQRLISLVDLLSGQTSNVVHTFFNNIYYYNDIHTFLTLKEEDDKNYCKIITDIEKIEFINVNFKYPRTEISVLNDLNFTLHKGKRYAFVGENGSGKTTIIKLLCGLYSDYTGKILINGIPLCMIDRTSLNEQMAVCFQDYVCYDMTIDENIRLYERSDDKEKLYNVLDKVGLRKKVSQLKEKEFSNIGKTFKNGIDFSGGEKQKIALARCLYKNASLYVLDEPTAALDPKSESEFINILSEVQRDSISLTISHRLGCTKTVDEILVLSNGHIKECGTYRELIKKRGDYYDMYQRQSRWYKETDE